MILKAVDVPRVCGEHPCRYKGYPIKPLSSCLAPASNPSSNSYKSSASQRLREQKPRDIFASHSHVSYFWNPRQPHHSDSQGCVITRTDAFASPSPPGSATVPILFSPISSVSSETSFSSQESFTNPHNNLSNLVQAHPGGHASSLLADPVARTYHLEVVQHPQRTAGFGNSLLSRLPLTPPIIARLTVRDYSGNSVVPEAELPFLIAHVSLLSGDGSTALDVGSHIGRGHPPPILYGNLVSSIDQLEDLQGNMGLFFVFPDVSIRWHGQFQLAITVIRISRTDTFGAMSIAEEGTLVADARTRPFDVLPYHEYTAVPPTRLTLSFLRQGARMFSFLTSNP